jgi:hypothetical protein
MREKPSRLSRRQPHHEGPRVQVNTMTIKAGRCKPLVRPRIHAIRRNSSWAPNHQSPEQFAHAKLHRPHASHAPSASIWPGERSAKTLPCSQASAAFSFPSTRFFLCEVEETQQLGWHNRKKHDRWGPWPGPMDMAWVGDLSEAPETPAYTHRLASVESETIPAKPPRAAGMSARARAPIRSHLPRPPAVDMIHRAGSAIPGIVAKWPNLFTSSGHTTPFRVVPGLGPTQRVRLFDLDLHLAPGKLPPSAASGIPTRALRHSRPIRPKSVC